MLVTAAGVIARRLLDSPTEACPALKANAAWASVDWTSTEMSSENIRWLADLAERHHIAYLYPFTTYVKPDGFSLAYVHAREFNAEFRKSNHQTKLIAWVGVPLRRTSGLGIDGSVDLADAAQRTAILDFVKTELIDRDGFDGVQFNVETTFDQNAGLLTFLDEARARLGPGVIIGVAGETWAPDHAAIPYGDRAWSAAYYAQVAARVDQIAAMVYDSRSLTGAAYQDFLRAQIAGISRSMAGSRARLLAGLSASREESEGHHPQVESVANALAGACAAAAALGPGDHPLDGVAMYASWEATDQDWGEWDRWIR